MSAPRPGWWFGSREEILAAAFEAVVDPLATSPAELAQPLVADLGWTVPQLVVAGLFAADLGGGVPANSTNTAKRWYHRPARAFASGSASRSGTCTRSSSRWCSQVSAG